MKTLKISLCIIATLAFSTGKLNAAGISSGPALSGNGIGAYVSVAPDLKMGKGVVQLRLSGATVSSDDYDDKFGSVKYIGDIDFSAIQLGVDWYPSPSGQFFVSAGIVDFDRSIDGQTKPGARFKVGDQQIVASDNVRLASDIDHSSIAPFVGVGWGNRHQGKSGLSFLAEVGLMIPFDDSTVDLSVKGNSTLISQENLGKHRKKIEDELDNVQLTLMLGIGYHF